MLLEGRLKILGNHKVTQGHIIHRVTQKQQTVGSPNYKKREEDKTSRSLYRAFGLFKTIDIGQEELVSCSSDYSTRWLAIK
jgi:hypothetical protein